MKKILFFLIAGMCLLLSSCGNSENLSISTPEKVYVTYYSDNGSDIPDIHAWELSQDEINNWVVWLNDLTVSPINLEESKALLGYLCGNGGHPQYSFDVGTADALERIAYFDYGLEHVYLHMDNDWYCVENPTEPFNRY